MGRSEPCILFAQTFVHPQLDEYVDEVIFAEPVIITACEFLEQNASSASQAVSLVGATSPPSFALEVFVRCEGESRFKRLCNPFLYTPSAPYPLEVEAVVTNHLVVRGSYRSLSLVIYGNIVKDLGQYNIILEGRSVTDIVSSAEANLEDLPLVLHSVNRTIEECLSSLDIVSLPLAALDMQVEVKQLLQLMLKIFEILENSEAVNEVVDTIVSMASSYVTLDVDFNAINEKHLATGSSQEYEKFDHVISKAKKEILNLYEVHQDAISSGSSVSSFLESETDLPTSKHLVDMLSQYIQLKGDSCKALPQLPKGKNILLGLSVALLLCSSREGCFHFVNIGGMDQLVYLFDAQKSTTVTLLLLRVVEQATRYSVGCEGILGWWPREDGCIPPGKSEGYSLLLKLLMQRPSHDIASLAIYILHRLRIYEVVSRYEFAVLSALGCLSNLGGAASYNLNMLSDAKSQLQNLLKLIKSFDTIEDPLPPACAERSLAFGHSEGSLSYKATSRLIALSTCRFSSSEIDSHVLGLLKERGFLPLSTALLSASALRSEVGDVMDVFTDIALFIGNIILSFMFSRWGLCFLLHHARLTTTIIEALKGPNDLKKEECVPLRYASSLISKGFTCSLLEVGIIFEMHLRVVSAVDRLLKSIPQTEEFLWILWELRDLSRSDCGRHAMLALGFFPEALTILIEALHSVKDTEPTIENTGISPLNLAIFHSAAEIFEVIVSDSSASSLYSWIEHASELHKALHSSSPGGSNRKDAPSRLLKWIDAGVVYHKHGVLGLLRYAAVLASGGDAQLSSTSILALDLTPAENVVGESSSISEINVLENLGKVISEKSFEGLSLSDSSVSQLTTTLRILAFISENSTVAATLYDEGVVTIVYAILVNCSFMFERSSNIYDYLVDDDHECSSISDFLSERNREQSLVDLLVPSLVLLISVLQKLKQGTFSGRAILLALRLSCLNPEKISLRNSSGGWLPSKEVVVPWIVWFDLFAPLTIHVFFLCLKEAKEQHRNTKLMNALLRLHREVSTKLAACAADLSSHYPDSALGFGAVCHLIVSALACWPVYGWVPGLFHSLLPGVQVTSVPALGPKEICSLLCILSDIFPEEDVWLWKNGMPLLSGLRKLAVGSLLGPRKETQINWYLEPGPLKKLVNHLTPNLDKIAQIIRHHAVSALVVVRDMLRVFIVRACQRVEHAATLLQPIFSSIREGISENSSTIDIEAYKVYRFLNFLACLLEHPRAKALLLEVGIVQMLVEVLERCYDAAYSSEKRASENGTTTEFSLIQWCIPVFKSVSLLCDSQVSFSCFQKNELLTGLSAKDCSLIIPCILKFCQVLPVGNELLSCLSAFRDLVSFSEGQYNLVSSVLQLFSSADKPESESTHESKNLSLLNELEMKKHPPFLSCWIRLLNSVSSKDALSNHAIQAVKILSLGSLRLCIDSKSVDLNRVSVLKVLFGLPSNASGTTFTEENIGFVEEMTTLLGSMTAESENSGFTEMTHLHELSRSLLLLLQKPIGVVKVDDITSSEDALVPPKLLDMNVEFENAEDDLYQRGLEEKFWWECPETLPERLSQSILPSKRKMPPVEGASSRRAKGESSSVDMMTQNTISRGLGSASLPPAPTRRDTFRQRKPNTSRPPSMHVDDYVARERSGDTAGNSNAITIARAGSGSGRPPSIHVDEFMARQRERGQNASSVVVGEVVALVKAPTPANVRDNTERVGGKSKQLKTDPDDDLQGIDIVFDGEESEEPDDKLPFLQPDENLLQPAPVMARQDSPHSIVEETESDANGSIQFSRMGTPLASNVDENPMSEFSSRMSVSRPEMPLTREPSISSDRKFVEQVEDTKRMAPLKSTSVSESGFASVYGSIPGSSGQFLHDSRMAPQSFYQKGIQHTGSIHGASSGRGIYDQKAMLNQPPLPPVPPPSSVSPIIPEPLPNQSSPFVSSGTPSPSGSIRLMPPLPSTSPPFSSNPYAALPPRASTPQSFGYNQAGAGNNELSLSAAVVDSQLSGLSASGTGMSSCPPLPLMPFSRPASLPMPFYGNPPHQAGEKLHSILPTPSTPQSSIQTVNPPSIPQLAPVPLPQLPHSLQPPQHLRPPVQISQPLEQGASLHSPFQIPMHQMQMMQQTQVSPLQPYYQTPQQQEISHAQQHPQAVQRQQGAGTSQQPQEPGMSLHEYFKSPEAIQSLLSDRDKLCQLLEQHPKLMQMLQEKLGQL